MYKYSGFLLLFLLTACDSMIYKPSTSKAKSTNIKSTDTLNQAVSTTKALDSLHRLKLVFVGDIMQHGNQLKSAFDPKSGQFDYEPCFRYIKPILEDADVAIGNLELTLNDKNLYSGYPNFRAPDVLGSYLKAAGFDLLVTSNNHSNDNNRYGLVHTLDVLDSLGIAHTGTFRDTLERTQNSPLIFEQEADGLVFRLAVINYTYGTNGIPTRSPSFVNEIDTNWMRKDIEKAKTRKVDMIIAFMHWGNEYQLNEHKRQSKLTKWLWNNGVDLVIGAHPHVVQPIKTDTLYNSDSTVSKTVLAAYSLGNFISNQDKPNTDIGLMFEVELIKNDRSNKTKLGTHHYIPVWRYIYNHKKVPVHDWVYTVVPCSAFEKDTTNFMKMTRLDQKKMMSVYKRTHDHLSKWQSEERTINFETLVKKVNWKSPDEVVTDLKVIENPFVAKILD